MIIFTIFICIKCSEILLEWATASVQIIENFYFMVFIDVPFHFY